MPSSEPEDQLRPPPQNATGEPSGPQEIKKETQGAGDTSDEAKTSESTSESPGESTSESTAESTGEPASKSNGASPGEGTAAPVEEKAAAPAAEPAWPPVEARPEEAAPAAGEEAVLSKPEAAAAPKTEEPAAEPKQEMGLSESTLHWLVDGEQPVEPLSNDPSTAPHYDASAPVAGRRRTIAVIGGAAILAVIVAALLHAQAAGHRAEVAATAVEPAAVLTQRAETALAAGRTGEAMDLAHLAIVADPRFADAYAVEGKVQRDSGRLAEARDAYRKYLELAPIGVHAEEARQALAALPP